MPVKTKQPDVRDLKVIEKEADYKHKAFRLYV
jgi:hypothetical protein